MMLPSLPDPLEPQDCRRSAEELLRTNAGPPALRAVGWALLAVVGELRALRRERTAR